MTLPIPSPQDVPRSMRELEQWLCWELVDGSKRPMAADRRTGIPGSSTNSRTWGTFNFASKVAREKGQGLGFVFTDSDPFVGIDLDKVRDPDTGEVQDWALNLIDRFDSYTEISVSGEGFHIFVRSDEPLERGKPQLTFGESGLEMYSRGRYFTMSGSVYLKKPPRLRTELIHELYSELTTRVEARKPKPPLKTWRPWREPFIYGRRPPSVDTQKRP